MVDVIFIDRPQNNVFLLVCEDIYICLSRQCRGSNWDEWNTCM